MLAVRAAGSKKVIQRKRRRRIQRTLEISKTDELQAPTMFASATAASSSTLNTGNAVPAILAGLTPSQLLSMSHPCIAMIFHSLHSVSSLSGLRKLPVPKHSLCVEMKNINIMKEFPVAAMTRRRSKKVLDASSRETMRRTNANLPWRPMECAVRS